MGTLQTTIKLNDQFSKALGNINKRINKTIQLAERMNRATGSNKATDVLKQEMALMEKKLNLAKRIADIQENSAKRADKRLAASEKREANLANKMKVINSNRLANARIYGLKYGIDVDKFGEDYEGIYKAVKAYKDREKAVAETAKKEAEVKRNAEKAAKEAERKRKQEEKSAAALAKQQSVYAQIGRLAARVRNVMTLIGTVAIGARALGATVRLSDTMTMNDAKLNLVAGGNKKLKNDLERKMVAAALRSSSDYLNFSHSVGKLGVLAGDKFKNNDSIVRFVELMNKTFMISGAETSERNAAMLQITQAIASNRLQGDEFKSVLENAPMVMKALEKSLGVGHEKIEEMRKSGKLTANVLINAMLGAGVEIDELFKQLPMTWERTLQKLKTVGIYAFKPIQKQFERLWASKKFQKVIGIICNAMAVLGNIGGWAFGKIFDGLALLYDGFVKVINWVKKASGVFDFLKNVIIALTIVTAIYGVVWAIVNWKTMLAIAGAWLLIKAFVWLGKILLTLAVGLGLIAGAFYLIANAQKIAATWAAIWSFVSTYYIWIIIGVLALLIYWFYKCSDGWVDTISRMVGGIFYFWEWLKWLWECVKVIAKNIGIAFNNGWSNALSSWWRFVKGCLEGVKDLEPAINAIAKAFGAEGFTVSGAITDVEGKLRKAEAMHKNYESLPTFNGNDAYNRGYNKTQKALNNVVNKIDKMKDNLGKKLDDLKNVEIGGEKVAADAIDGLDDKLGDVGANTKGTEKNTGDIANSIDYSYLRDWAYQKGLGNSIGYNIKIEQNNRNNVASGLDVDRIANLLMDKIVEGLNMGKEGVVC